MLFAVCSDRGAPGSTTTALTLAAARGLPAVVVEADPYGGDLVLRLRPDGNTRHPLPPTPTVLGVAAGRSTQRPQAGLIGPTTNRGGEPRHLDLWRNGSHRLSSTVRVVPGFLTAEQGSSLAWPVLTSALQAQTVPVFADLGRIHTGSPSMPLAAAADALITVCRADMGSVTHMTERLEQLVTAIAERNGRPPLVLPVVIADRRHGARLASRIAEVLDETAVGPALRGVGWLAWDPTAVQRLEHGGDPWARPLRKSHLMQSARKAMWLLGTATGIDHAEPETHKPAESAKRRASTESALALQQGLSLGGSPPPATGGHSASDQAVTGHGFENQGSAPLDEPGRRWQTAPVGEEI